MTETNKTVIVSQVEALIVTVPPPEIRAQEAKPEQQPSMVALADESPPTATAEEATYEMPPLPPPPQAEDNATFWNVWVTMTAGVVPLVAWAANAAMAGPVFQPLTPSHPLICRRPAIGR